MLQKILGRTDLVDYSFPPTYWCRKCNRDLNYHNLCISGNKKLCPFCRISAVHPPAHAGDQIHHTSSVVGFCIYCKEQMRISMYTRRQDIVQPPIGICSTCETSNIDRQLGYSKSLTNRQIIGSFKTSQEDRVTVDWSGNRGSGKPARWRTEHSRVGF